MMDIRDKLRAIVMRVVEKNCPYEEVGVSFSGGVDSSLLASACRRLNKKVTLLTVGFPDSFDVERARDASLKMRFQHVIWEVSLSNLKEAVEYVSALTCFSSPIELELAAAFYLICKLAKKSEINTVMSAQGADELFCGYEKYRSAMKEGGEEAVLKLMDECIRQAFSDRGRANLIADSLGVRLIHPFLDEDFVNFCLKVPVELKMRGVEDDLRKRIWRELAVDLGVPVEIAFRHKKALQYGSGIHRNMVKVAREEGFGGKGCLSRYVDYLRERYLGSKGSKHVN